MFEIGMKFRPNRALTRRFEWWSDRIYTVICHPLSGRPCIKSDDGDLYDERRLAGNGYIRSLYPLYDKDYEYHGRHFEVVQDINLENK